MKLDHIAKVTEIVGGIAVLISLVVLIAEVRENNQIQKRAVYDQVLGGMIEWRRLWLENPELQEETYLTITKGKFNELDELARHRQEIVGQFVFLNFERAYWAYEYEQLGEAEWARFRENMCRKQPPFWDAQVVPFLSKPFVDFLEQCFNR